MLQRIIRENILGVAGNQNDRRDIKDTLGDFRYSERETFFTPKQSFNSSTLRYRQGGRHTTFFPDSHFESKFSTDRFMTPNRSKRIHLILGSFGTAFSPHRQETEFESRYSFQAPRFDKNEEVSKYEYTDISRRRGREFDDSTDLPDFVDISLSKEKFYETIENLKINNRVKYWLENTKEWMHRGILKSLLKLDIDNLVELCRLLSRVGYNLVFEKDEESYSSKKLPVPSDYDQCCKYYFDKKNRMIDMNELMSMELKQTLVGKLYGKYYYSIKGKLVFEPNEKDIAVFEKYLSQRRDIESYFTVEGFGPESRFYVYYRILNLTQSTTLNIKYNSGMQIDRMNWSSKFPTDAHIIMSMF